MHAHELVVAQVGLHFVEELQLQSALGQARKQRVDVAHVEDVVDAADAAGAVGPAQPRDLLERPLRRLRAERHRLAVQSAEGAVVLRAPPAAARRFDDHVVGAVASDRGLFQLREVVVVIGIGQGVEVLNRFGHRDARAVPLPQHAFGRRRLAAQQVAEEGRKAQVRFAAADVVDPVEGSQHLEAHLAFAVRAPKDNDRRVRHRFEPPRHREAAAGLMERRREADDRRREVGDPARRAIEKVPSRGPRGDDAVDDVGGRAALQDLLDVVLGRGDLVAEEVVGEEPLTEEHLGRKAARHFLIEVDPHPLGHADVLVVDGRREPGVERGALEQAHTNRGPAHVGERHYDKDDIHARLGALMMRRDANARNGRRRRRSVPRAAS